ncbi:hypothetical protein AB6A40_007439 [Gnathostoma spinigerum]|uniref:Sjoegren syndrome/scleroderma autoantigen 1 n=1 Tax=Gnathostoma spinigerum TaxID=75299 RepID=A0ABD6EWU1_9BILA
MVHRHFGAENSLDLNEAERMDGRPSNESETLNGLTNVKEEQRELLIESQRRMRDQISSKMGDMLLRGYTMLNAYCQTCSGILMQDRGGELHCVTCDLLNAELTPQPSKASCLLAEIPLDSADLISDSLVDHPLPERLSQAAPSYEEEDKDDGLKKLKRLKEDNLNKMKKIRNDIGELPKCSKELSKPNSRRSSIHDRSERTKMSLSQEAMIGHPIELEGLSFALKAVDRKLKWCSTQLDSTEDCGAIIDYLNVIKNSMEILEKYCQIKSQKIC